MTTDIGVTTVTHQVENRSWLQGPHGTEPGTTPSVTVDPTLFVAATHYPNGFIPSGTVLSRVTATGLYGPYDSTATDGRQLTTQGRIGILFSSLSIRPGATKVGGAILVHGFVDSTKLPLQVGAGGITAAAKTALSLIFFTA